MATGWYILALGEENKSLAKRQSIRSIGQGGLMPRLLDIARGDKPVATWVKEVILKELTCQESTT